MTLISAVAEFRDFHPSDTHPLEDLYTFARGRHTYYVAPLFAGRGVVFSSEKTPRLDSAPHLTPSLLSHMCQLVDHNMHHLQLYAVQPVANTKRLLYAPRLHLAFALPTYTYPVPPFRLKGLSTTTFQRRLWPTNRLPTIEFYSYDDVPFYVVRTMKIGAHAWALVPAYLFTTPQDPGHMAPLMDKFHESIRSMTGDATRLMALPLLPHPVTPSHLLVEPRLGLVFPDPDPARAPPRA